MKPQFSNLFLSFFRCSAAILLVGAVVFSTNKAKAQYCVPAYSNGCSAQDNINDFTLNGITPSVISDLGTGCGPGNGYEDRTALFSPLQIMQGGSYNGTITTSYFSNEYFAIFIDLNDNFIFEPSENLTGTLGPFGNPSPFSFTLNVPLTANTGQHRMRVRLVFNNSTTIDPCTSYFYGETQDYYVFIQPAPPCTGTPTITGLNPSGTIASCAGATQTITALVPIASGYTFQWEQSTNGGGTWTAIPGATGLSLNVTVTGNADYRLIVTCTNSGQSATSSVVTFTAAPPTYAPIPYVQDFENWQNYCAISDIPSSTTGTNWTNQPATGDSSWRRFDQGLTAGWTSFGTYTPSFYSGQYSARFPTGVNFSNNAQGDLNLYLDCSQQIGDKQLYLRYINQNTFSSGGDSLTVLLSTNGGLTFNQIGGWDTSNAWYLRSLPIQSNSPQTIVKFRAKLFSFDFSDIGLDSVFVASPCSGKPDGGTVDSVQICSGIDFQLKLSGATSWAGGLSYQWQESNDGINWTNIFGATTVPFTYNITAPTYFRAIVTCNTSGLSDTSDARYLPLASFYYCYCQSYAQSPLDDDIGNVTLMRFPSGQIILNNGVASPLTNNQTAVNGYSNFTAITPPFLYKDSTFNISVTHITSSSFFFGGMAAAYIDYNQDGQYDPITERVMLGSTSGITQTAMTNFTVPSNAATGYTGMRVVLVPFGTPTPCGSYFSGETEDYVVYIDLPPCNGPTNPGTAFISDTLLCPGFPFTVVDTTHEKFRGNIAWMWQASTDNGATWTDIPGTNNLDTIALLSDTVKTYYRLKMICQNTGDMTYSNPVYLNIKPFYQCYCPSYAIGGTNDISDIGIFTIGNFVNNTGGGHLNNPTAVYPYTDYTNGSNPIYLIVDSTYYVSLLHTMSTNFHQDAKVTMFIDFNNNRQYDIPQERVWTGYSSQTTPYLNTQVTIPANAVRNVLTGMRLILNNDVNPNAPSDEACGTYTSGETEDYVVMFKDVNWLSVGNLNKQASDVVLYPNPSRDKCTITASFVDKTTEVLLTIADLNGSTVKSIRYQPNSKHFATDIDLGQEARGVYLITLTTDRERIVRKLIVQ